MSSESLFPPTLSKQALLLHTLSDRESLLRTVPYTYLAKLLLWYTQDAVRSLPQSVLAQLAASMSHLTDTPCTMARRHARSPAPPSRVSTCLRGREWPLVTKNPKADSLVCWDLDEILEQFQPLYAGGLPDPQWGVEEYLFNALALCPQVHRLQMPWRRNGEKVAEVLQRVFSEGSTIKHSPARGRFTGAPFLKVLTIHRHMPFDLFGQQAIVTSGAPHKVASEPFPFPETLEWNSVLVVMLEDTVQPQLVPIRSSSSSTISSPQTFTMYPLLSPPASEKFNEPPTRIASCKLPVMFMRHPTSRLVRLVLGSIVISASTSGTSRDVTGEFFETLLHCYGATLRSISCEGSLRLDQVLRYILGFGTRVASSRDPTLSLLLPVLEEVHLTEQQDYESALHVALMPRRNELTVIDLCRCTPTKNVNVTTLLRLLFGSEGGAPLKSFDGANPIVRAATSLLLAQHKTLGPTMYPNLTHLSLQHLCITDDDLLILCEALTGGTGFEVRRPKLVRLDLSGNRLSDSAIPWLLRVPLVKRQLTSLSLRTNAIGLEGLKMLEAFQISRNSASEGEGTDALRPLLPIELIVFPMPMDRGDETHAMADVVRRIMLRDNERIRVAAKLAMPKPYRLD